MRVFVVLLVGQLGLDLLAAPVRKPAHLLPGLLGQVLTLLLGLLRNLVDASRLPGLAAEVLLYGSLLPFARPSSNESRSGFSILIHAIPGVIHTGSEGAQNQVRQHGQAHAQDHADQQPQNAPSTETQGYAASWPLGDAAFFRVGEPRGGLLVKFHPGERQPEDELRDELGRHGLEVGRFLVGPEADPLDGRSGALG